MVLDPLDQRVNCLKAEAVLTAAVEGVGLVNEQHAAQRALDDRVRQRGRVADIAAHQIGAGDLHELAAAQCADGLQVLGQYAGNRRLACAGVSGKDHVHVDLGNLHALSLAALLCLHVFGDVTHITLDFIQADDAVQLSLHRVHIAAVLLGQQRQQVKGVAAVHGHAQPAVLRRQRGGRAVGGRLVGIQHVLGNRAVDCLAVVAHSLHTAGLAVLRRQQIAHICAHGQRQSALPAGALGQIIQLPRGHGSQRLGGERLGAADVARNGVHKLCPKVVGQRGLALVGVEHKILAAGLQLADGTGGQRRADIHEDAALQNVPARQCQRAVHRQRRQHIQVVGGAALVMLKGQHLGVGLQRRVKVLQKQLLLRGAGVERQIQRLHGGTVQHTAGGQLVHHALQRIVAARAVGAAEQHHAAGVGGVVRRAQHKRAAERLDQRRDKGILPQHLGLDLFGHSGKIRLGGHSRGRGGRSHGAAQQTVLLERLRQFAAHPAHALRRGGPCLLHGVQCAARGSLALLGLGQGVQLGLHLRHGVVGVLSLLRCRGVLAAAHQAADPGIVLVFQAHRLSSVSGPMQASAPTDFLGSLTV